MGMKVAFTGDVSMGKPLLDHINKTPGVELSALAYNSDKSGIVPTNSEVHAFNIKDIHSDANLNLLKSLSIDLIVNFNSLEIFLPQLLSIPRIGSVNFHPGPLPEYAGLYVYQWAILNGEEEFGATIHWMEEKIDSGNILSEERFPVSDGDTGLTLYFKALKRGVVLFKKVIELAAGNGDLTGFKQDLDKRKYYSGRIPNNGFINWEWSAEYITRFVRALSYRPYVSPTFVPHFKACDTEFELVSVKISEIVTDREPGRVLDIRDSGITVSTGKGAVVISKIYLDGSIQPAAVTAKSVNLLPGDQLH